MVWRDADGLPGTLRAVEELIGVAPSGERKVLALERPLVAEGRVVLKFEGYDTPEEAQARFVGYE